ncbi:serine/threonine-protein kinase [Planobispora takensis]|uniref:Protein kinase domain-containing protein n=1 Tax=Planobispora takensis TaxID=1367882 RepID=A0A8J3T293_9ACTN|nr:serine/threonine-protein kinase [Planobispora takensis]GII03575.1 hypothetical protein Pta02_55830 [Planobispora takensis]
MDPLQPRDPDRVGGYRLLGRLGEGGQGTVYLAEDASGLRVAVKTLNAASSSDPVRRRYFASEASLIRQVSSFCVAEVLDADLDSEHPYIVSEYVEGPSLRAAVATAGPRTGGALRRLAIGTVTALAAIHQAGIVHRDFKPPNVLLGPDGARVIDFGIARLLDTATTTTGNVIGTVAYMSPEQVSGSRVGFASDMFGWAATMAYAAGGRPPFGQDSVPAIMYRILHSEPDLPALPADLAEVVEACLAKDPDRRPSAREVLLRLIGDDGTGDGTTLGTGRERPTAPAVPAGLSAAPSPALAVGNAPFPASPAEGTSAGTTAVPAPTLPVEGASAVPAPTLPAGGPPAGAAAVPPATLTAPEATRRFETGRGGRPGGASRRRWLWGALSVLVALAVTAAVMLLRPGSADPVAEAGGELLFSDDFSERRGWDGYTFNPDAPEGERTYRGHEIERGVFSLRADQSYPSNAALSPVPLKDPGAISSAAPDVLIGVTARMSADSVGPGEFGLMCRWDEDIPQGYRFLLGLDGAARVTKAVQGIHRDLGSGQAAAPSADRPVRLQAACRSSGTGTRLTFWVDGTQVIDVTDPQAPVSSTAQSGLIAQVKPSGGGPLTVSFDDFALHRAR